MKKQKLPIQTDINNSTKNNYQDINRGVIYKFQMNKNLIASPMHNIIKTIPNRQNNNLNNKRISKSFYPNQSPQNYTLENIYSNPNFSLYQNKNIKIKKPKSEFNNTTNTSPTSKHLFDKIQKEIKMMKIQLSRDILKNKIQLLNDLGKENNNYNYYSNNTNIFPKNKNIPNQKKTTLSKRRNIILTNNNYFQTETPMNNANMINANSLKNIYYINNNFRINSIQNNERKKYKIPKSALVSVSPINYHSKSTKQNTVINIPINGKKFISNSPNYFFPKSALNENNNLYNNSMAPKSFVNILFNKNNNSCVNKYGDEKIIKIPKKTPKVNDRLPQGDFDDYLLNSFIVNHYKNSNIKTNNNKNINNRNNNKNDNKNNNKININNYKTEQHLSNELKIDNYNNFFINNTKSPKDLKLQTENKIIDFSYIGSSNNKSKNLINKNKVINNINFSFNPKKIIFNNKEPNKKEVENNNQSNNNKTLSSLIDPCDLEEKSVILENIPEKKDNNPQKKQKVIFEDDKLIIKYNQNDYIRYFKSIYKDKINEKAENETKLDKCDKVPHKFISTTLLCNKLKKKNKNLKTNLNNNNNKYNPNDALMKLNELIFDEPPKAKKEENNNKDINKNENNDRFIKKNINFIKKVEECNKKGLNYRSLTLSKREIKLLKKKKKNLNHKNGKSNENDTITNKDDTELLKIDKNNLTNKLGTIQEDKLHNSFS